MRSMETSRFWRALAAVATLIFIAATSWIVIESYSRFKDASAVPVPPDNRGKAYLFFDRPGVPATIDAFVDEYGDGFTSIDYLVNIGPAYPGADLRFFLVL